MLSADKLNKICERRQMNAKRLASQLVRTGLNKKEAAAAIRNWQKGLFKPEARREDIHNLATALSVEVNDLVDWCSSYRFAPLSADKARLVAQLIVGRSVQDAMDILKFTRKRAATVINKVLKSAVANADEQQANVDNLYVSCAQVHDAGRRAGTRRWIPKDRGKAYPIRKRACHIHIAVAEA